jgi:hypothetical protein
LGFKSFLNRNKKDRRKSKSIEQEIEVKQEKEVNEKPQDVQLFKRKEVYRAYGSSVPPGCKFFLGYLNKRPKKSSVIPKECIVCKEVLECLIHQ